jgi:outer membrane protein TolC
MQSVVHQMIKHDHKRCLVFCAILFQLAFFHFLTADCDYNDNDDGCLNEAAVVLNLENSINIALSAQRRMGSVMGNVAQSEIILELAESDFDFKYTPKGDAGYVGGGRTGAGYTLGTGVEIFKKFTHGSRFSIFPSVMKGGKAFQSSLRGVYTQPLLRGFGTEYTLGPIRGAQFSNRAANRSYYLAQVRLILQTVQGLYDVVRQESYARLEEESLVRIRKFCSSTKMKEKIGLCDSLDLYRAEIELKRAEDSLDQALDRLQDSKDALRDTLALPLDLCIKVDVPLDYEETVITLESAISMALSNRIEIDQADDQLDETRRLQYMAKCNIRPELNLVLDYTSSAWDETFTGAWTGKRESKWGIGFATSTDICHVRETAAYEQSILTTADAQRNAEQARDNVILDIKRTLRGLKRAHEKITLQEKQIENSMKEFHLARVKFEHGLANNFDLIQAEKNLRSSQTGLVGAIIDHKIGQFKLLASLGMLADKPDNCRWKCRN